MTVKSTVSFTDRHHAYAQAKAKDGQHGSVSSVVASGIERLIQDETERNIALQAMSKAIQARMNTPYEEWTHGVDDLFDKARQRLTDR